MISESDRNASSDLTTADTESFDKELGAAPRGAGGGNFNATEVTKRCCCIPKGHDDVEINPLSVTIKRSLGLCNLSKLSSWSCANFELKHIAYLHMTSDEFRIAPLARLALVLALASILCVVAEVKQDVQQAVPIASVVVWVIYFLVKFLSRTSTAVFGAYHTALDDTWIEFARDHRDQMVATFLTSLYAIYNLGAPPAAAPEGMVFSSKGHAFGCIPNGEDKMEIFPEHVKIKSTEGVIGQLTGSETLSQKVRTSCVSTAPLSIYRLHWVGIRLH
jgi:hypothetical protein